MISETEFKEWLEHPVTLAVKQALEGKREALRQAWEGGSFTDYTEEGIVLVNVGNIGTCKGYAWVQDLTWEELETELKDD